MIILKTAWRDWLHMCVFVILMLKLHIFHLSTVPREKNAHVVSSKHSLAAKLPHATKKCMKLHFWHFYFLMRLVRLDFTHMHQLEWFGAGWRKWGGWNACPGKGRGTVSCVSCHTKHTYCRLCLSRLLTHGQLLAFVTCAFHLEATVV